MNTFLISTLGAKNGNNLQWQQGVYMRNQKHITKKMPCRFGFLAESGLTPQPGDRIMQDYGSVIVEHRVVELVSVKKVAGYPRMACPTDAYYDLMID